MKRFWLSCIAFLMAIYLIDSSLYEALAVAFSLYSFLTFICRIGERIALSECIGFIATLEILLIPAITYWVFPGSMPIESVVYFGYALPACISFCTGINSFFSSPVEALHRQYIQLASAYLQQRQNSSIVLFIIGLAGFLVKVLLPGAPAFMGTLPMNCLLISGFYAYYSRSTYRVLFIGLIGTVLVMNTIRTGMFGDLFFWLLLLLIFSTVNLPNPLTVRAKLIAVSLGFAFLLLVQSVKGEYRYNTWGHQRNERNADANLMVDLLTDRLTHPEKLLTISHLFGSFVRFNQGIMIGSAMAKVPIHEAYAHGEVLLSLIYPLIPRPIWPGKPITGGYENIRRFTTLPQFENTSINLSPVGEGYVNFGYGGILFAWLYGLLLGGCFHYAFCVAEQIPSAILWLPMLYSGCLTMETDLLSTWGSLINNAIFIALLFWLLKRIGIEL